MGKQSRIKELKRELTAEDQKLFLEGQEAGRRMEALGLDAPPSCSFPQLQHIFSSIYAVTVATWVDALEREKTQASIAAAAQTSLKRLGQFERMAFKIFELENDAKPDCKVGCQWCCFVRVTIKPHEAILLEQAIAGQPAELRERSRARMATLAKEIEDMPADQLVRLRRLCPLNEEGRCTVYEARPTVCRTTHSYSVKVCRDYAEGGKISPSRVNGIVMEFGRAFALATVAAFKHAGLDSRSFDLANLVQGLAENPKLVAKWAAGGEKALDRFHRQDAVDLLQQDLQQKAESQAEN